MDGQALASPASYDLDSVRADFPILSQHMHGKPLVFLDSAASAQKPRQVIDAVSRFYETGYANIHRGVYQLSQDATEAYEATRETVRAFINADSTKEIIFTRGATEGINLVANSWGRTFLKAGDEVVLSAIEHHSNIVPWQMLRDAIGITIKVAPVDDEGALDFDAYEALLSEKTKLVAFVHISNAIGTELPAKQMIAAAHKVGAKVLVDGCQAAPHRPLDMQDLDADFYVFSGHKVYGPTGIGVLYGKRALLEAMPPWQGGGDMISTVTFEKTTWNDLPYKFEAGTPNIAGGIGLKAALDYVLAIGFEAIMAHEADLLAYATEKLAPLNDIRLIGCSPKRAGILSIVMEGCHPHDIGTILDREGIAVRAGHHCAQPAMDRFNVPGTARASFGLYTSRADVDALIRGLEKVKSIFG
ncbi:cysteine desulfurase [Iodidimonas muriae]|uniref:Cysteine desulfurase n=1 Tax=Iodidimonas muriae TaxID=261467 RepID=A0ABQ2L913_9PROT|nr:cysteine desulfurase [Iodidimonas muriae]GGO07121.1 cysteine desulfurase [Iodidimonas muriae]